MSWVDYWIFIVLHVGAVYAIRYPLVYWSSPWKAGDTGRALMWKARAVATLYLLGVVAFWTDLSWHVYLQAVVYTFVTVAVIYQFIVMKRKKKLARKTNNPNLEV